MSLALKGIHHIAIIAGNYQRSKRFYVDILGLEVVREIYREERKSYKLDLRIGQTYCIELFSFPDSPQRVSRPEAQGLRHLAFAVDDIESAVAYLNEWQIEVEEIRIDPYTGKRYTFFQDPDNLPLELYEER